MSPAPPPPPSRPVDGGRPRPSAGLTVLGMAACSMGIATAAGTASADAAPGFRAAASTLPGTPAGATLVRLTGDRVGRGRTAASVTRVDLVGADGAVRHVADVRNEGEIPAPTVSPDGTHVAFARPGASIAVVRLRDGRVRILTPPDRPETATHADARTAGVPDADWAGMEGVPIDWSADGRTLVAHGLLRRAPVRWLGALHETRTVRCDVARERCSTAGRAAPSELGLLASGRTVRLDAPSSAPVARAAEGSTDLGASPEEEAVALGARDRPVRSRVSVARPGADAGRPLRTGPARGTARGGVVAYEASTVGASGVLLRPTRVALRRVEPSPSRAVLAVLVDRTRPWLVTPAGRLQRLPRRVASPIGTLPDGRWLQSSVSPDLGGEPQLTTVDRRGEVRPLLVAGRPVTPVRLTLEAGLSDTFAVSARVQAAWPAGEGAVAVALENPGEDLFANVTSIDGIPVAQPAMERALVVLPLDGAAPARLIDHTVGASYAAR